MGRSLVLPLLVVLFAEATFGQGVQEITLENLNVVLKNFELNNTSFLDAAPQTLSALLVIVRNEIKLAQNRSSISDELKARMKEFHLRITQVPEPFRETASLVDSEPTLVKLLGSIKVMNEIELLRQQLLNFGDITDRRQADQFDNAFDKGAVIVNDALFGAFYDRHGHGDQLFLVASKVLHRHPIWALAFMRRCVELLLHAFVLEVSHLSIIAQPEATIVAMEKQTHERLAHVIESVWIVDRSHYENISSQIGEDLKRRQAELSYMKHCTFSWSTFEYFREKYPHLYCIVQSYNAVSGTKLHAVRVGELGSSVFEVGDRNVFVACKLKSEAIANFHRIARTIILSIPFSTDQKTDYALKVNDMVTSYFKEANVGPVAVSVVRQNQFGCASGPTAHFVKTTFQTKKCGVLCWKRYVYDFDVIAFG